MKFSFVNKSGLIAGLFFPLFMAQATTFGPIPVVEQARNSQYYVRGHVVGASWTEMEPRLRRPYTYWRVQVSEQQMGEAIPAELIVRQPGGEIGEMGYHMAGTAEFNAGEDTFIALHDTDEAPGTKEVVGLASGKYKVEPDKDGKQIVVSGLGIPVTGEDGRALSPEAFSSLLHRIARGEATAADKNIFVTRKPTHEIEENAELTARVQEAMKISERHPANTDIKTESGTAANGKITPIKPADSPANPIQQSEPGTEEPSTGSSSLGWILALGILAGLIIGLFFALRR